MGELIQFPYNERLEEQGGHVVENSEQDNPRFGDVRRRAELLEIRNALKDIPTLKSAMDVEIVAHNLSAMLEEAKEKKGISKIKVAKAIWPDDESPLKRFDKLTLPLARIAMPGRIERLQKRTSLYCKVALELAKCTEDRAEKTLVRLFRNTSVDRRLCELVDGRERSFGDLDDSWQNLAEMFDALAERIKEKVDFKGHMTRIVAMGGKYDLSSGDIFVNPLDVMSGGNRLLNYGPLSDNFEIWDHFPPIPSVLLVGELLLPRFRHPLSATSTKTGATCALDVEVRVWREIRLAIGPIDSIDQVGPLFEARTRVDLGHETKAVKLIRPWLDLGSPDDATLLIDGEEYVSELDFETQIPSGRSWSDLLMWQDMSVRGSDGAIHRFDLQPQHDYAAWRRVTAELCAELLDKPKQHNVVSEYVIPFHVPLTEPTLTPEGTLGAAVELAIRNDSSNLASSLLQEAERLIAVVKQEQTRRRAEARALNDQAVTSWSRK
ncbi:hypothetical protein JQ615_34125 [Bradyrhizobium jicamae]|uniref:Uncharacterized protein n=1 Tax=Bradyrhizobium jicamae TaxID=280332 RepID=A0ABS5FUA4_9BRAD|nr:hypothetical protein [Bradyrhizobium jicamae]MBR0800418.1 hypothetical protein [Bradyrhizobium jicamae]